MFAFLCFLFLWYGKLTIPLLLDRSVPLQTYQSKYGELLNVIEDLGREIKPTYAGSKMAQERLKKGKINLLFVLPL